MTTTNLTGHRYDNAQTEALRQRDVFMNSILARLADARRESGNTDVVADCLDDIIRDAQRALAINADVQTDDLSAYDVEVVTCSRCTRQHQARHSCVCRG